MRDFLLPDLGEGLTDGEIVRWLVAVGDRVEVDQPVAEISTEKAMVEVPTPFAGVVVTLHGQPGELIRVGQPLLSVEEATAAAGALSPAESGNVLVGYGTAAAAEPRRRRVTRADLERSVESARMVAAAPPAAAPSGGERIPLTGARRVAAERLSRSHSDIPDAAAWLSADATALLALRDALNARQPAVKVTSLAVLLRLCVEALRTFPLLNAHFDPARWETLVQSAMHLGVAVQAPHGLLVPVIRDAGSRSTFAIAAELNRLAAAARDGSIAAAEMSGATFTVSNFGSFGVDGGIPIINPPQAGILGVGRIAERPWVVDGAVTPRSVIELSLVFDHRVCDGSTAGGFLRLLGDLVEQPPSDLAEASR